MKNIITAVVLVFTVAFSANAQNEMSKKEVKTIALEQTPGEFTQKQLTVSPGTYVFEIANKDVGHDVGFVLVKKGEDISKPENHIQTAYVTEVVATGKTQSSNPTVLEAGEYVYFCPMNPTATDNTILVK
ncbi:cupredoxin domain-containing protein [Zobellia galactanivorans]|uniref:cupredoxin domain-containing protein n=1 Tax=Zobellia galactanivorans (strain DSM 12802 / CCUG 47099 / CIP 106680 / NCIMB 13871 / Dsij) TaxID=63186 RepID=UPI0026E31CD6|nr:cupredoxin domain-containing protein [Zobellia galactanivorans]MDO6809042.1 cupredoxin domain-containing protein [Zobellia galactanivorans]